MILIDLLKVMNNSFIAIKYNDKIIGSGSANYYTQYEKKWRLYVVTNIIIPKDENTATIIEVKGRFE
jgi:hypothetical protein